MNIRQLAEKDVEKYLVGQVLAAGGVAEKIVMAGTRGYFDRVVALPGGRVVFVEVKKPKGSHVAAHQRARHQFYRALGCEVVLVKSFADVDRLLARRVQGNTPLSATG
jgi:hypothetical protein